MINFSYFMLLTVLAIGSNACLRRTSSQVSTSGGNRVVGESSKGDVTLSLQSVESTLENLGTMDKIAKDDTCSSEYMNSGFKVLPKDCKSESFCTATLVNDARIHQKSVLLTAAHCATFLKSKQSGGLMQASITRGEMFAKTRAGQVIALKKAVWSADYSGQEADTFRGEQDLALIAMDPSSARSLSANPAKIAAIPAKNLLPASAFNKVLADFFLQKTKPDFVFPNSIYPQSWLQESLQDLTQIDHFGYGISNISIKPYAADRPEIKNEIECLENAQLDSKFKWDSQRNVCTFVTEITNKEEGDLGKLQSLKLYVAGISSDGKAVMTVPVIKESGACSGDSGGPQYISGQNAPVIVGILSRGPYGKIPYCKGTPNIIELLEPNMNLLSKFASAALDTPN